MSTTQEYICPDCRVERTDYKGPSLHLEFCPNCSSTRSPVTTQDTQTPQRLCNAQHGPYKVGNAWTKPFYCDKPYGHEDRHESGFPEDRFTWFVSPDPTIGQVLTEQKPQQPPWEQNKALYVVTRKEASGYRYLMNIEDAWPVIDAQQQPIQALEAALRTIMSRAARLIDAKCDHKWGDVWFGIKTPEPDEVMVNYIWRCEYCGAIQYDHGETVIRGDTESFPQNAYAVASAALLSPLEAK